ncbi:MAG: NAD+ synthase [Candidatus Peregrinibacteria bacterium]|nr:NAD+ synthase [Candidatus Peregrinibacteria bacterium]MDZ4245218.1 NAD+ synthase [Candidatus Gracilibacteria bacterium]
MQKKYEKIVKELTKFFNKNNFKKAVIGLSGGIDSSLVLKLAVDALRPENVVGILMPETGLTKEENITHAKGLADFFKVQTYIVPINSVLVPFNTTPWHPSKLAQMNTKARARMILLYSFANTEGACVLGTSNKSEILLGYGTKHGDSASDIYVIGDLFKTEVWKMAELLGLPDEIIQKAPSAELTSGQTDEEELGASYIEIDKTLQALLKECEDIDTPKEMKRTLEVLIGKGMDSLLVRKVVKLIEDNRHKSKTPPTINT